MMDLSGLSQLVGLMRREGVRRLKCDAIELELEPLRAVAADVSGPVAPATSPFPDDACHCGHSMAVEHSEGGCLFGCSLAVCTDDDPIRKALSADK